jgi:hypothetical protein
VCGVVACPILEPLCFFFVNVIFTSVGSSNCYRGKVESRY